MKFLTSDLHFGHQNVINYCNRPFKDLEEMHEVIINSWNGVVTDQDEVYVIGDFSLNPKWSDLVVPQLKGTKILVMGNHDAPFKKEKMRERYLQAGWSLLTLNMTITLTDGDKEYEVDLCHFPFAPGDSNASSDVRYLASRPKDYGQILLHGHSHCYYLKNKKCIDVGIDHNFNLHSEKDIITLIEDPREYIPSRITEFYKTRKESKNDY